MVDGANSTVWSDLADVGHFLLEGPILGAVCVLGAAANTLSTVILLSASSSSAPSYAGPSASSSSSSAAAPSSRDQLDFSPTFAR